MTTTNQKSRVWLILITVTTCALLAVASLSSLAQTAVALPPRPTPVPTATPTIQPGPSSGQASSGGSIELRVRFPSTWQWDKSHWQDLWTVVQWQDEWGYWRNVEGWQGTLDDVADGEGGAVVGKKAWWVAEWDLGKGPFRWRVYQGWRLLAQSGTFDLPDSNGATVMVGVSLAP